MPTQVFMSLTPAMKSWLPSCKAPEASRLVDAEDADLDEIYRLVEEHTKLGGDPPQLYELMQGSEVVRRKELPLEAEGGGPMSELERMRLEAQERSYQRMIQGVAPVTRQRRKDPGEGQYALKFATSFATQAIVAFIGAFLFGYYFVETFVSPDAFNAKVIAGAACSFSTLLLETVLLVIHEQKEQMKADKEQQREERLKRRLVPVKKADPAPQEASERGGSAEPLIGEQETKPTKEKKED